MKEHSVGTQPALGAPSRVAPSPLLYFSTRQGRQTNCLLTVEVARYVAEALGRRVLPLCHTSPLGGQACEPHPEIPSQRQEVVQFGLHRVLMQRDLSRCTAPASTAPALVHVADLPVTPALHNGPASPSCRQAKWCATRDAAAAASGAVHASKSSLEMASSAHNWALRFVRHVTLSAEELLHARTAGNAAAALVPAGDVFLSKAFHTFTQGYVGSPFALCVLPRETEASLRMARQLEEALSQPRAQTLCVHWRGEDFHHPTTLQRSRSNASSVEVVRRWVLPLARRFGVRHVLLLTNVRHEGLLEISSPSLASTPTPTCTHPFAPFRCATRVCARCSRCSKLVG